MKIIEDKNKNFFDKIARYYDSAFGNWIKKMQSNIIKNSKLKNNARILDAGCGTGNLLSLLEERNSFELYGIDISKEMLGIARKKLRKTKLKIEPVEKLSFKDNFFDYIFSIDAFHHYSDKEKSMNNFYSALKRNGKLIVVDVDFGLYLNKLFHKLEPGNNGIYDTYEMRNLFKRHNFKNIKQNKVGLFTKMTTGIK